MWVIDIRHMLDDNLIGPGIPRLAFKVKKLTQIIIYATAIEAGIPVGFRPTCWRRPARKPCKGQLDVDLIPDTDHVHWMCPVCGDDGMVTGWKGLLWDLSEYSTRLPH